MLFFFVGIGHMCADRDENGSEYEQNAATFVFIFFAKAKINIGIMKTNTETNTIKNRYRANTTRKIGRKANICRNQETPWIMQENSSEQPNLC
jgi:hypothetical protein